jgi:inosose dehydratase
MGIQSYSLRAFSLAEALEKTHQLGLRYIEIFPGQMEATTDQAKLTGYKDLLKKHDITLLSYGVVGFGKDAAANRRLFEFAKAMGIQTLTADPEPESFPNLEELVEEFKVSVAIHNHGPGSRYDKIADVEKAVTGRHPRIGACVDTGHFLRSDEDPVDAVKRLGKRVYGIHLKDVTTEKQFTEVGKGKLRTADLLRELRRLNFRDCLALEYEEHEKAPMPYIEECLAATRAAWREVSAGPRLRDM